MENKGISKNNIFNCNNIYKNRKILLKILMIIYQEYKLIKKLLWKFLFIYKKNFSRGTLLTMETFPGKWMNILN